MKKTVNIYLFVIILLIVMIGMSVKDVYVDKYHGIGGGSPGFVSYAIRSGGVGGCGCGFYPDGRPMCDMTGPISYA